MEEHSLFETVEICGSAALRSGRYAAAGAASAGIRPEDVSQRVRLFKRGEGRFDAYIPADLAGRAFVQFSRFEKLELEHYVEKKEGRKDGKKESGSEAVADDAGSDDGNASDGDSLSDDGTVLSTGSAGTSEAVSCVFRDSDVFSPCEKGSAPAVFRARAIGSRGRVLEEAKLTVYVAQDVPTLYLATESGGMEAVNADKSYREQAHCLFYTEDGEKDVSVRCRIHGRGNSSWKADKKQYSLNLSSPGSVLGMEQSEKFALIANHSDGSNLRNKAAFDVASLCGLPSTPQSAFVNVYFNGLYNGLYLIAQRPNARGGSVRLADLEGANAAADTGARISLAGQNGGIAVVTDEDGLEIHASPKTDVPEDISGGYLLEMDGRYEDEDYWVSTSRHHFVVKYPEPVPLPEAQYIADYLRKAENSFYTRDASKEETSGEAASSWEDCLDRDSWVGMYLLQDYFCQWDVESFSFFVYKDAGDPLLYCGPAWDFDLSAGHTGVGRIPNIMQRSMWLRDHREGWLTQLAQQPSFREAMEDSARTIFFPLLDEWLGDDSGRDGKSATDDIRRSGGGSARESDEEPSVSGLSAGRGGEDGETGDSVEKRSGSSVEPLLSQIQRLGTSASMDCRRWGEEDEYEEDALALLSWLRGRSAFLQDYTRNPEDYCTVTFRYGFADMDIYVRRGEQLGFVPLEEYGERLYGSFRRKYGEITGWTCGDGSLLSANTTIDRDQVMLPVVRQE